MIPLGPEYIQVGSDLVLIGNRLDSSRFILYKNRLRSGASEFFLGCRSKFRFGFSRFILDSSRFRFGFNWLYSGTKPFSIFSKAHNDRGKSYPQNFQVPKKKSLSAITVWWHTNYKREFSIALTRQHAHEVNHECKLLA